MAKSTENRKDLLPGKTDLRGKGLRHESYPTAPISTVEQLIDLLLSDDDLFAEYILGNRVVELLADRKKTRQDKVRDQVRSHLLSGKGTTSGQSVFEPKPLVARRRLDEVYANGPRSLTEAEAKELLDQDPEAIAFLRLKLQVNAKEVPLPWVTEMERIIARRSNRK